MLFSSLVVGLINILSRLETSTKTQHTWFVHRDRTLIPFSLETAGKKALESQGMTSEPVAEYRDKNRTYFLRDCRRLVQEGERLLKRIDLVIGQFRDVVDAKSGEILLLDRRQWRPLTCSASTSKLTA